MTETPRLTRLDSLDFDSVWPLGFGILLSRHLSFVLISQGLDPSWPASPAVSVTTTPNIGDCLGIVVHLPGLVCPLPRGVREDPARALVR